jgi:hypothetical protein
MSLTSPLRPGTQHGPTAFIVRRNTTGEPLHVTGSYEAAYRWCVAQPMNGLSELMWPEGRVPVHVDPEHYRR